MHTRDLKALSIKHPNALFYGTRCTRLPPAGSVHLTSQVTKSPELIKHFKFYTTKFALCRELAWRHQLLCCLALTPQHVASETSIRQTFREGKTCPTTLEICGHTILLESELDGNIPFFRHTLHLAFSADMSHLMQASSIPSSTCIREKV